MGGSQDERSIDIMVSYESSCPPPEVRRSSRSTPSPAQHSTAQHSTAQHSTAQHSTAQHSTTHQV